MLMNYRNGQFREQGGGGWVQSSFLKREMLMTTQAGHPVFAKIQENGECHFL